MKTLFDSTLPERRVLQKLVAEQLHQRYGFTELPIGDEASRKRKTDQCALFGNYLDELPVIYTEDCGFVPLFLYHCVTALSQFVHLEGLFRKAGSIQRQKELRSSLEQGRAVDIADISLAYDIACLIKQFLRELPEPIFTESLASSYLRCAHTPHAVLLLSLLLPPAHVSTLKYVCRFLKEVSDRSELNKMSVRNLALVFSPSLFPNEPIRLTSNSSRPAFESGHFHNQILVLEVLIANADALGVIPPEFLSAMESSLKDEEQCRLLADAGSRSSDNADSLEPKDVSVTVSVSIHSRKRKSRGSIQGIFSEISHSLAKLRRTSFGQSKENVAPKFDPDSFADTLIKEISVCVGASSCIADDRTNSVIASESMLKERIENHTPKRRMSMEKFESGKQVVRFRKSLDSKPSALHSPYEKQPIAASAEKSLANTGDGSQDSSASHCQLNSRRSCASSWRPVTDQRAPAVIAPSRGRQPKCDTITLTRSTPVDSDCCTPKRSSVLAQLAQNGVSAVQTQAATEIISTPKVKPQMADVDVLLNKTALCRALQASTDRRRICAPRGHEDRRPAVQVNLL